MQCFQHKIDRNFQVSKNRIVYSHEEAAAELKGKKSIGRSIHNIKMRFNLPYNLTDEWIERHEPSLSDYRKVLQSTEVRDLGLMSVLHNIKIYTSVVQIGKGADGKPVFSYSNSTQFKKKIEEFIVENRKLSSVSKMVVRGDIHKPPLTLHFISKEVLNSIPPPRKFHNYCLKWKGVYVVLMEYYNGYAKFNVVEPLNVHRRFNVEPGNLITRPDEYVIDGIVCCSTKEYFAMQTKENHDAIMAVASSRDLRDYDNTLFRLPAPSTPYIDQALLPSSSSIVSNCDAITDVAAAAKSKARKSKSKSKELMPVKRIKQ
jgi:hypothetical protein